MSKEISRIQSKFQELAKKRQKALITYVMVGYPDHSKTQDAITGLIKGGADIIELGFPFSDPLADGPVIQNASNLSLKKGTKLRQLFLISKKIRRSSQIPLVVMTYANILYCYGYDRFFKDAKKSGIDGVIIPDMTVEESDQYIKAARKHHIDTIFLVSPNTNKNRLEKIIRHASGFLYLVSVFGTTGVRRRIQKYTMQALKNTKKLTNSKIPVGIGFGISTPKDVRFFVNHGADAVIVGSVLINLIEKTPPRQIEAKIQQFTRRLKSATL